MLAGLVPLGDTPIEDDDTGERTRLISFRDAWRGSDVAGELDGLERLSRSGDAVSLLVQAGEVEQGILDALHPDRDGWSPVIKALRDVTLAAARAFLGASNGDRARAALSAVPRDSLPTRIRIKAPEGYLHYALDPAAYADSARRYAREAGGEQAARAVVLGIRSIGTSLSAVAAAALGTDRTVTLRPRGPSGGRTVEVDRELGARLESWFADGGDVLVVDEGPGSTGETFWCVRQWLRSMHVDDARIVLLPSGGGGMPLAPAERRDWFASARKFAPEPDPVRIRRIADQVGIGELKDLSWGGWRGEFNGGMDLPAAPNHERLKFRGVAADGSTCILRYAGLGRWGSEAVQRARVLAEVDAGPAVLGAADGFITLRWIEGHPARRTDADLPSAAVRYLAARAGRFRAGTPADPRPLIVALEENAREALGDGCTGLADAVHRLESLPEREAVIADARLQAHEWIRGPKGIVKVDAIDHGAGTRLPGPVDSAWDLAGAAVEFGMEDAAVAELVRMCASAAGEDPRALADAVAAYRAPYTAACLSEATFARWEAGSDHEARVLDGEVNRYRTALASELG
jgi:hypothetical protein